MPGELQGNGRIKAFPADLVEQSEIYFWPLGVRELKQRVSRSQWPCNLLLREARSNKRTPNRNFDHKIHGAVAVTRDGGRQREGPVEGPGVTPLSSLVSSARTVRE